MAIIWFYYCLPLFPNEFGWMGGNTFKVLSAGIAGESPQVVSKQRILLSEMRHLPSVQGGAMYVCICDCVCDCMYVGPRVPSALK